MPLGERFELSRLNLDLGVLLLEDLISLLDDELERVCLIIETSCLIELRPGVLQRTVEFISLSLQDSKFLENLSCYHLIEHLNSKEERDWAMRPDKETL